MLEIYRAYRAYRNADFQAMVGEDRLPRWEAIIAAVRDTLLLWAYDRAAKDVWADPDFTWTPREPHGLDEVDYLEPVPRPRSRGAVDSAHWWRQ